METIIRDEAGNILSQLETAGTARNRGKLVNRSSKPVYSRDKKTRKLVVTAHEVVWIKTLHGKLVFSLQKYQVDARETNYLTVTNQLQEAM